MTDLAKIKTTNQVAMKYQRLTVKARVNETQGCH